GPEPPRLRAQGHARGSEEAAALLRACGPRPPRRGLESLLCGAQSAGVTVSLAAELPPPALDPGILDLTAGAVFFPVRHHSPACRGAVRRLALELRPAAILIGGPSDFNDRIHELFLPHRLPIAIYTFTHCGEARRGAYYPFCVYSPEWQALQVARELV